MSLAAFLDRDDNRAWLILGKPGSKNVDEAWVRGADGVWMSDDAEIAPVFELEDTHLYQRRGPNRKAPKYWQAHQTPTTLLTL